MSQISIVGLGPGSFGQLTVETLELLHNENKNYFRTVIHPVVKDLEKRGIVYCSFDGLYEDSGCFEDVYESIAEQLVQKAEAGESLIYAVPGNPLFGEQSVINLMRKCLEKNISYQIYSGVSFVDISMMALEEDPVNGLKIIDAFEMKEQIPDKTMGNLITQVFNRHMASEVKLSLLDYYPDDYPVVLLINAGIPGQELIKEVPLCEVDWVEEINHLTTLYIPPDKNDLRSYQSYLKLWKSSEARKAAHGTENKHMRASKHIYWKKPTR